MGLELRVLILSVVFFPLLHGSQDLPFHSGLLWMPPACLPSSLFSIIWVWGEGEAGKTVPVVEGPAVFWGMVYK